MLSASEILSVGDVWRCYNNDSPRVYCETRLDGLGESDRVPRYSALSLHEMEMFLSDETSMLLGLET